MTKLINLFELDASHNSIMFVPDSFENMRNLISLDLSYNQLESFVSENLEVFSGLRNLNLSNNQLYSIPDNLVFLYYLRNLDLSYNCLVQIPPDLWRMKNLEILRLNNNYFASIPESIAKLAALQELYLASNSLVDLPSNLVKLAKKVKIEGAYEHQVPGKVPIPSLRHVMESSTKNIIGSTFSTRSYHKKSTRSLYVSVSARSTAMMPSTFSIAIEGH